MINTKDNCAVIDVGQTEFMVNSGQDRQSLAFEPITNAVKDAGPNVKDINGF